MRAMREASTYVNGHHAEPPTWWRNHEARLGAAMTTRIPQGVRFNVAKCNRSSTSKRAIK